jgi:hypothetical protein
LPSAQDEQQFAPAQQPVVEEPRLPSASCSDGIRNQGESGVDCGGPCRPCKIVICGDGGCGAKVTESPCPGDCKKDINPLVYIIPALLLVVLLGGFAFYKFEHRKKAKSDIPLPPPPKAQVPEAVKIAEAPPIPVMPSKPATQRLNAIIPKRKVITQKSILDRLPEKTSRDSTFGRLGDIIKAKESSAEEQISEHTKEVFSKLSSLKSGKLSRRADKLKTKVLRRKKPKTSNEARIDNLRKEVAKTKRRVRQAK